MNEIDIEFVGDINELRYSAEFTWENFFFDLDCTSYGSDVQEYEVKFPAKDYNKMKVIRLNHQFYPIIKEKIVVWVDKPGRNKKKLVEELKKECLNLLNKELQDKEEFTTLMIYEIFENEDLKIK